MIRLYFTLLLIASATVQAADCSQPRPSNGPNPEDLISLANSQLDDFCSRTAGSTGGTLIVPISDQGYVYYATVPGPSPVTADFCKGAFQSIINDCIQGKPFYGGQTINDGNLFNLTSVFPQDVNNGSPIVLPGAGIVIPPPPPAPVLPEVPGPGNGDDTPEPESSTITSSSTISSSTSSTSSRLHATRIGSDITRFFDENLIGIFTPPTRTQTSTTTSTSTSTSTSAPSPTSSPKVQCRLTPEPGPPFVGYAVWVVDATDEQINTFRARVGCLDGTGTPRCSLEAINCNIQDVAEPFFDDPSIISSKKITYAISGGASTLSPGLCVTVAFNDAFHIADFRCNIEL